MNNPFVFIIVIISFVIATVVITFIVLAFSASSKLNTSEACPENVVALLYTPNEKFSIDKTDDHTDWVKVQMLISEYGKAISAKPVEYSNALYIDRTPDIVKKMTFKRPEKICLKDIYLYQTIR